MISTSRTSDFQISGSAISSHKNIHEDVSEITHAHNISKDICVKYIHIAKDLLDGMNLQDTIKKEVSNEFFDELLNVMQRISYQVVMLWTHSKFPYGVY